MSLTVLAPPLQPGQLIREWKRSYLSGVALLTAAQKLEVLPLYVNRSKEEQDIAYEAIKQETVALALTYLEEFIDGTLSKYDSAQIFFTAKCCSKPSLVEQTRFYFQLRRLGEEAGMPEEVIMTKFLTEIPAGKKLYKEKSDQLVEKMTAAASTKLFKEMKPKLEASSTPTLPTQPESGIVKVKQEPSEMFSVEEVVPVWAKGLREDFKHLSNKVDDLVLTDEEEAYHYQNKEGYRPLTGMKSKPLSCYTCGKRGHGAKYCWDRVCPTCKEKGHSAHECPSKRETHKKNSSKKDYRA